MGDRQGRPSAAILRPFVGVDLDLRPTVYIAVIVLTRTQNESNTAVNMYELFIQFASSCIY